MEFFFLGPRLDVSRGVWRELNMSDETQESLSAIVGSSRAGKEPKSREMGIFTI